MNIFKKALIVALSVGLISVPTATKEVEVVNAWSTETKTLYLDIGNIPWTSDNAKLSIYYWNDFGNGWSSFMNSITSVKGGTLYYATVPTDATKCIFVRLNSSATTGNWNQKWNQTGDMTISSSKNVAKLSAWDNGSSWNQNEYPAEIKFNLDGGTYNSSSTIPSKSCDAGQNTIDLSNYSTANKDGFSFNGWSDGTNVYKDTYSVNFTGTKNSVTLTAQWKEVGSTDCAVTYDVGGKIFTNTVPKGTSVIDGLPEEFESSGYIVKSWKYEGTLDEDKATVVAKEYVKTFDETKAELGFDYSYVNRAVVFQAPTTSKTAENKDTTYPVKFFYKTANGEEESVEVTSELKASDDWKNEFMLDLDTKYTQIRFEFKNEDDKDCKYPADGSYLNRDYNNNAIWWNKDDQFGSYPCSTYESAIDVKEVSNMSLRLGTGNVVLSSTDFGGVVKYGVSITRGSVTKTQEWSAEEAFENNSLCLGLVLSNIDSDYWTEEFTTYCYAVYEDNSVEKITVSDRTFSVKSLANIYATNGTTSGVTKVACEKIAA